MNIVHCEVGERFPDLSHFFLSLSGFCLPCRDDVSIILVQKSFEATVRGNKQGKATYRVENCCFLANIIFTTFKTSDLITFVHHIKIEKSLQPWMYNCQ